MPFWKWALLFIAGLFLSVLLYGAASMVDFIHVWWIHAVVTIVIAAAMLWLYAAMLWLYAIVAKGFEGRFPQDLPIGKLAPHMGLGLAFGLGYFVIVTGIMALTGCYKIESWGADWMAVGRAFMMFLIVAIGEEIIFRGVLFRWVDEKWGFPAAMVSSAFLFGLVHITNPGGTLWASIAIAIEAGLLLGAAYKWSGTLWLPIGIHWAWNFAQGNIFGFAVSGNQAGDSIIVSQVDGPAWLTGGAFGAEASVIAVVVGALASAWFIWRIVRK